MSISRLNARGIFPSKVKSATLFNYHFVINKISKKNKNIGFANIIKKSNSKVEGVLFQITKKEEFILDKVEGFPNHYKKISLTVFSDHKKIENVITFVANEKMCSETQLKTSETYKNFILQSKTFVSPDYFHFLENYIQT